MKDFYFTIVLHGFGEDIQEAWQNACEEFMEEPGIYNEERTEIYEIEEEK